jgi:hypothetical protein
VKKACWCVVAVVLLASGCGKNLDGDEAIPLGQVPPAILKAAKDRLPDVKFEMAYRATYDGQKVYEIRGKTKAGKIRECEVNDKGEVVNVE